MSYNISQRILAQEQLVKGWMDNYARRDVSETTVVYYGYVTGLTHHDYSACASGLKAGVELFVRPDPKNKYDPNAIGLCAFPPECADLVQVGWVPKALNTVAALALREGHSLRAKVTSHYPDTRNPTAILKCSVFIDNTPSQPLIVPTQEIHMSKLTTIAQKNIDLGTSAAFLEAGRIANNQLSSIASKKLPIMVRAYADTALGRLLLANVALMARDHFRPDDERLGKLVNAMTVSAYQEVLQNFDVEQMIDDLVSNSTIKKALKSIDALPAAED